MNPIRFVRGIGVMAACMVLILGAGIAASQPVITLHGASQFTDDHAFTKAMVKFEELVKKYYGKPVTFVLHKNSELGLEKDYFAYMNQGKAVDYAIVSPAHMSTFSRAAPFIDAPFIFRDLTHWNKVLDADLLKPVADEIAQKADVMLIGYAGGGTRNIFVNKPVRNLAEMKALKVRVQGAPIWSRTFAAVGMSPTVIAYNEVYNAIQNGVIAAGENEYTRLGFRTLIETRALSYVQPDVQRVGGVTEWLRAATLAGTASLPITPHLAHEYHVHVMAATPNAFWIEFFDWAPADLFAEVAEVRNGAIAPPERPGFGVAFTPDALRRYAVPV